MRTRPFRATIVTFAVLAMLGSAASLPAEADDLDALAARVRVLEDREELRALILAYGQAHDHRDSVTTRCRKAPAPST